jgi:O-antigen/teichoic acid export membrane protein
MLHAADQRPIASTGALLVRGSFLRVLTLAAGMIAGLVLMPFLIHSLGDRLYGIWTLAVSITAYYALLDFGLTRAATRFLARAITLDNAMDANCVVVTALAILVGAGALGFVASIGIAFGAGWFSSEPTEIWRFRWVVVILGADAALLLPTMVVNAVLLAHYRFDVLSSVQLAALAVRTALIVGLVLRGHSIVALAIAVLGTNMLSRAVLVVLAGRLFPWLALRPALFDRAQARQLLGYGRHAFLAACSDRIRSTAGIIVVAAFLDLATVTHYGIAARIAQLFAELMLQSLGVVGPLFMRTDALGNRERTRENFLLTTRLSVLASVTTAGGIALIGGRFIEVWIGEDYGDAYWPLVILTGSLAVWLMQWPAISILYASARHRFYAYLSAGEAVANVAISIVLVQHFGTIGVALGTTIPLLVSMLVLQPPYVCRTLGLEVGAYYRELGNAALYAVLGQAALFALVHLLGVASLTGLLALSIVYYPLCWAVLVRGLLPEADRRRIGAALPTLQPLLLWRSAR